MNLLPNLHRLPLWLRGLLFGFSIYVLVQTSMRVGDNKPGAEATTPFDIEFTYNLGHQFLYGFFTLTLLMLLPVNLPQKAKTWVWLPLLVCFLGMMDEWNQSYRFRGSGMNDVGSDVLGAVHILLLALWFSKARKPWQTAVLISTQVWIGVTWNMIVVYAPDPALPFLPSGQ
jgi:VanZ family protein